MSNVFLTKKPSYNTLERNPAIHLYIRRGNELLLEVTDDGRKRIPLVVLQVFSEYFPEKSLFDSNLRDVIRNSTAVEINSISDMDVEVFLNTDNRYLDIVMYGKFSQFDQDVTENTHLHPHGVNKYEFCTITEEVMKDRTIYGNTLMNKRCIAKLFPDKLDLAKYTELAEELNAGEYTQIY